MLLFFVDAAPEIEIPERAQVLRPAPAARSTMTPRRTRRSRNNPDENDLRFFVLCPYNASR
jgi:hypothetical protein